MRFLAYRDALMVDPRSGFDPMPAEAWSIPVEGDSHRDAALKLLSDPAFNHPGGGTFWVHLAVDEPWNRHPTGVPMTCRALEITFTPNEKPVSA